MAWNLFSSTSFSGPVPAVSAGQVLQNGWTDLAGGQWSINANGQAVAVNNTSSPWQTGPLLRPASEDTVDVQAVFTFALPSIASGGSIDGVSFLARHNRSTSSARGYIATIHVSSANPNNYTFTIYPLNGGTLGTSQNSRALTELATAGSAFLTATISVVQTNGTTTTITLSSVTAAGSTTNLLTSPVVFTDTTSALQNVAGSAGFYVFGNTGSYPDLETVATYTDLATATGYSLTGPNSGPTGTPSGTFQFNTNAPLTTSTVFTPSDSGGGGTFNPATVTIPAGSSSGTFTYTGAATGSHTISATNSGSLTNPAALTYSTVSYTIMPVTSAKFSPGNWKGDTGRGGSVYRQSWNNGAWCSFTWTASASPVAVLQMLGNSSSTNLLTYFINGTQVADGVAGNGNLNIGGIVPSAVNTLLVYLRSSTQSARWNNGVNTVQIQGLLIDTSSTPGTPAAARPWCLIVGDSIPEGIHAAGTAPTALGPDSHLAAYSHLIANALDQLGYDTCISACGSNGWLHAGDGTGDVPGYYVVSGSSGGAGGTYSESTSRWDKIDQGVSLLDANGQISSYGATNTAPAIILINFMTNEWVQALNSSDCQASVTQCLVALRAAAPNALIFVCVPFGLYTTVYPNAATYLAALKNGVSAYQGANPGDLRLGLIDLGAGFSNLMVSGFCNSDLVHPLASGHALIAPPVLGGVMKMLATPTPTYAGGFHP